MFSVSPMCRSTTNALAVASATVRESAICFISCSSSIIERRFLSLLILSFVSAMSSGVTSESCGIVT